MFGRNRQRQRGATLVEFTLSFMLLVVLAVGTIEMGRAVWTYSTLTHAAREAARYAMAHGSLNPATQEQIASVVSKYAIGLDRSKIQVNTTWDPSNQRGNIVQVQARYEFLPVTSQFIVKAGKIPMAATSRMVIAN